MERFLQIAGYATSLSLFIAAVVLVHRANAALFVIKEEVNHLLPEDKKSKPRLYDPGPPYSTGVPRSRVFELLRKHRELFPASLSRRRMWKLSAAYFICFFASFLLLYVLGRE